MIIKLCEKKIRIEIRHNILFFSDIIKFLFRFFNREARTYIIDIIKLETIVAFVNKFEEKLVFGTS